MIDLSLGRVNVLEGRSLWGIEFFPAIVISAFFSVDANNDNDDGNEGYKSADSSHYDWNYIYFAIATNTMLHKI